MVSKRRERLLIIKEDDVTIVNIGDVEIWDGADLALLRETLTTLIETENCRSLGIDMATVKYIPSGFFGMLFEWYERGIHISLFSPQPNVENMLWFRLFFRHHSGNRFILKDDPDRAATPPPSSGWTHDELPPEIAKNFPEVQPPIDQAPQSPFAIEESAPELQHATDWSASLTDTSNLIE